jgi:hypothetical protein
LQGGLCFLQGKFVIGGINFKEDIAGCHRLIVLHVKLDDLPRTRGAMPTTFARATASSVRG